MSFYLLINSYKLFVKYSIELNDKIRNDRMTEQIASNVGSIH